MAQLKKIEEYSFEELTSRDLLVLLHKNGYFVIPSNSNYLNQIESIICYNY